MRLKEGGTSRTEQSALTTRVGLPGKKDGLVCRRKVSNAAGGVSNAMGGKEDGAGIGDNKRAGGCQSRGATAKAAKTSRKVEEGAGVGRKRGTGEFLEEFKGRGIDGVGEGGGPEAWIKVVGE